MIDRSFRSLESGLTERLCRGGVEAAVWRNDVNLATISG
jgi:hypothetical protein